MKLLHGTKVTCEIEGKKITDAKISKEGDGSFYICQNKKEGVTAENKLGYNYSWCIVSGSPDDLKRYSVTNLRPVKDISDISIYQVGDILVDEYSSRCKVLGVCGLVVIISTSDFERASSSPYTTQELEEEGYYFENSEDTLIGKELTKTIKGKKYKVVVKEEVAE